jgi:anti-sigma regulatory factor (Ser/Thr protein kinase)
VKTLTIKNEMNELDRFISWIEEELKAVETPIEVITKMKIALEEAVVNVINYSQMPAGSDIVFSLETKDTKDGHQLVFTIKDTGVEFDPTQHNKAILDGDPTERPIGGLGIHMMHEIMDVIEYLRENHHNILTLKKNY